MVSVYVMYMYSVIGVDLIVSRGQIAISRRGVYRLQYKRPHWEDVC